jgi:Uma2 family endonuclease
MATPQQKKISYADYLTWDEEQRCEVLDGEIISMSPSPTPKHQDILRELTIELGTYLRGKDCKIFTSPLDVCLFADKSIPHNNIKNWVEPDLIVVCDKDKIGEKRILGAPDLVIEILSPSTAKNDRVLKFHAYEKAGVKEYWIIDPFNQTVEVYLHDEDSLKREGIYFNDDTMPVNLFKDFNIDLQDIFPDEN